MSSTSDTVIQKILNQIGTWLSSVIAKIGDFLWSNFKPVYDRIASWLDTVFNALKNVANSLNTFIQQTVSNIQSYIESAFTSAFNFLKGIYDRIAESVTSVFDNVSNYLQGLYDTVSQKIIGAYEQVSSWLSDIYTNVSSRITSIAAEVTNYLSDLYASIKGAIGNIINSAGEVVTAIYDAIKAFIANVIDTVGNSLRDLLDTIAQLPDVLSQLGEGMSASLKDFVSGPLSDILGFLNQSVPEMAASLAGVDHSHYDKAFEPFMARAMTADEARQHWHTFFTELLPESVTARAIFQSVVGLFLIMRMGGGIADANAQIVLQEFGKEYAYNIPQLPDALRLRHFGLFDDTQTIDNIQRQGYSAEDANRLIKASETLPPEGESLTWWLRSIIDEETYTDYLKRAGWSDQSIAAIKEARYFIPPVQDLITMAVREVFSPDIAEQFGQFEDYPTAFTEWAQKQGVSEQWAKNYWAAHWALPSPQMGFEMFQRRIITRDELIILLKALDVMPYWRDKLIDLSYAPLTRVDVRRMHAMGVLNEDEVFNAYLDIGYSPENAQRMLDFTIQYNAVGTADNPDELKTLTRTAVLNFYTDGLLTRQEALDNLLALNYSRDAAELYLASIDMEQQRKERKDAATLVVERFKAGLINFSGAQDELARQHLEERELVNYLTDIVRIQTQRTKIPSKADLDKFYMAGLVNDADYLDTLHILGYSDHWAGLYLKLNKVV